MRRYKSISENIDTSNASGEVVTMFGLIGSIERQHWPNVKLSMNAKGAERQSPVVF